MDEEVTTGLEGDPGAARTAGADPQSPPRAGRPGAVWRHVPDVTGRSRRALLGFAPIPLLAALMAVVRYESGPTVFYDPPWLILAGNTLFIGVVCFIVAAIALRKYLGTGRVQILFLGCGVLTFGIGAVLAALVRRLPGGANLNVTIYNTAALTSAGFHFIAALILLAGLSPEMGARRKAWWLVAGYAGSALFMLAFTAASLDGLTPAFFVQGIGPTPIRQWVLGIADVLFLFSFLIFAGTWLRNREVFLYWYSCALALTAISLTAFFIQSSVGSAVGWVGRFSQYLGGIYFLAALVTAIRSAQDRGTSLDNVLVSSLSGVEEKFRALAENSPDAIRRFDAELRHLYVNAAGLRLLGRPASAVIGRTLDEAGLPPAQCAVWRQRILDVFRTGEPVEIEEDLPLGTGTGFFVSRCVPEYSADGRVANVLVVSRDLTLRKHAEAALRKSEERYRTLFTEMAEGFALHEMIWDAEGKPADYRFLAVNPAFERMTGLIDVVGRTVREAIPEIEPAWIERYGRVVLTGISDHFESFSAALGRWYEVYASRTAPGQFSVIFLDVTERKRVEQALKDADRRKDEFLAMLAHELRNPLAAIVTAHQVLRLRLPEDERVEQSFCAAERQTAHMSRMLDDLLDVSRVTQGKIVLQKEPVDLRGVVHTAVQAMTGQVEAKGHEVAISLPPERLVVNGDPVRLTQVVSNLVGNAARYTPDGGKIKVSAVREGDHAVLRVRDNGPGISAELLPHVFELFVQGPGTLDRGRGGLGIGLTLVRSLVEMHGGAVSARSEGTEKGSEFIVRLPLLPAGEREVRTVPCAAAPGTGRSRRILVVEDNKDLARSFADLLSICGHEVRIAYDGPSGIDLASEYLPDAVFLDIGLPGMDGYEVARRLRQDERTARIPLFAMSGYGQAEDIRRSQEVGFTEHLLKPVGAERLLGLLDALPDR